MAVVVATPSDLLELAGTELGVTDWVEVTQERIAQFADATGDQSHDSADGGPIAHGYLTLSLANLFLPDLLRVEQFSMGVNVGLERVRFPSPVPSGARIRGRGEVVSAEEVKGGAQVVVRITIEVEGSEKPACVADTVSRFLP